MLLVCVGGILIAANHGGSKLLRQLQNVYSGMFMVNVFIWVYGLDVYIWLNSGIDFVAAFMLNPQSALGHKQVWTLATILAIVPFLCALYNAGFDVHDGLFPSSIAPLITYVFYAAILLLPLPMLYRNTRMFLLRILLECLLPFFFGVELIHIFVADVSLLKLFPSRTFCTSSVLRPQS